MLRIIEKIAETITKWVGSISSLFVHTIIFAIVMTSSLFGSTFSDREIFLTNFVSIEAIYLAILIQMTVNKQLIQERHIDKDIDSLLQTKS